MYQRVVDDGIGIFGLSPKGLQVRLLEPHLIDHIVASSEQTTRRAVFRGRMVGGLQVTTGTPEGAEAPSLDQAKPVHKVSLQLRETANLDPRGVGKLYYSDHDEDEDGNEPGPLVELSLNVPPGTIDMLKTTDIRSHGNVVTTYIDDKSCELFADAADRLVWDVTRSRQATLLKADFMSRAREPIAFRDPDGFARGAAVEIQGALLGFEKLLKLTVVVAVMTMIAVFTQSCRG